jgi:hypothetical protein
MASSERLILISSVKGIDNMFADPRRGSGLALVKCPAGLFKKGEEQCYE